MFKHIDYDLLMFLFVDVGFSLTYKGSSTLVHTLFEYTVQLCWGLVCIYL